MNARASRPSCLPRLPRMLGHTVFSISAVAAVTGIAAVLAATPAVAQSKKTQNTTTTQLTVPVVQVTKVRPDAAELTIRPDISQAGFRQQFQVISGPNAAGTPISTDIGGTIRVGLQNTLGQYPIELLPNSDYSVRVRNIKTSVSFSDWVTVVFRTTEQFESRPGAPGNLRITQQTATNVTLAWDAPSFAVAPIPSRTYELFLNNQRTALFQCGGSYVFCTEADFRTVTITRPPAGTPLTFGVAARDAELNRSELSTIRIQ